VEVIRGMLVVPRHVHLGGNSTQLVDELEMKRLMRGSGAYVSICSNAEIRRDQVEVH